MNVLIVKTSSMGDLIHTLPALSDASRSTFGLRFDWVAEKNFAEIPKWHPSVHRVIPVELRKWRKQPFSRQTNREIRAALREIQSERYDHVIDAQGLIKSAIITFMANGIRSGMNWSSCKEGLASIAYRRRFRIARNRHAIDRLRELFSLVLNYRHDPSQIDYGLASKEWPDPRIEKPYLVFLHASSNPKKYWGDSEWLDAARLAKQSGYRVVLPHGNTQELAHARALAALSTNMDVLAAMNLSAVAGVLRHAAGVIGIDTGLAHLAAALGTPAVTLYIATSPTLTGTRGDNQLCLALAQASKLAKTQGNSVDVPGFTVLEHLDAATVWEHLRQQIASARSSDGSTVEFGPGSPFAASY